MQQVVTLQYLQAMQVELTKQAEQHYANWQATLGAVDLLKHLAEVASNGTPQPEELALELAPTEG